jgi:hypothetical protein
MSNNEEPTIADSIFKIVVGFLLLFIFYHTHPNFFENQLKLLCKPLLILDTM